MLRARVERRMSSAAAPTADPGEPIVVATVVGIDGSSPRTLGTSMAWDGESVIGSIAGGCVEGATVEVAERVLDEGRTRTVEFGVSDEAALGVGLSCGALLRTHLALLRPDAAADAATIAELRRAASGQSARVSLTAEGYRTDLCDALSLDSRTPPARMTIVGAMNTPPF
jgi:xanthine dehydrogenase accessory factor